MTSDPQLADVSLPRSGSPALVFHGRLLAAHAGKHHRGREHKRYFELALYLTDGGKYVLHRHYHTSWRGESNHDHVLVADSLDDVAAHLSNWRPRNLAGLGHPPTKDYAPQQKHLLDVLTQLYEDRVSSLLADVGAVERIE